MLQMNKNTAAKAGSLLASVIALGTILGLVRNAAPAADAATQSAQPTPSASMAPAQGATSAPAPSPTKAAKKVKTRTHAS